MTACTFQFHILGLWDKPHFFFFSFLNLPFAFCERTFYNSWSSTERILISASTVAHRAVDATDHYVEYRVCEE